MAKKISDPKKKTGRRLTKKQKKTPGWGNMGTGRRATKSELAAYQKGLSGKVDVSSQKKLQSQIEKEQKAKGEKPSSYTQKTKGKVTTVDTRTGRTIKSKTDKRKAKDQKKAVKAYHKRVGSPRKVKRAVRKR